MKMRYMLLSFSNVAVLFLFLLLLLLLLPGADED